jgi:hypothetical protein
MKMYKGLRPTAVELNLDLHSGKPATNVPKYGMVIQVSGRPNTLTDMNQIYILTRPATTELSTRGPWTATHVVSLTLLRKF